MTALFYDRRAPFHHLLYGGLGGCHPGAGLAAGSWVSTAGMTCCSSPSFKGFALSEQVRHHEALTYATETGQP